MWHHLLTPAGGFLALAAGSLLLTIWYMAASERICQKLEREFGEFFLIGRLPRKQQLYVQSQQNLIDRYEVGVRFWLVMTGITAAASTALFVI